MMVVVIPVLVTILEIVMVIVRVETVRWATMSMVAQ